MTPLPAPLAIRGGTVLLPDSSQTQADVVCAGTVIDSISSIGSRAEAAIEIDAHDALVLPGLVDIHGDGFERTLMPRPGVFVDVDAALAETRAQLLAAGITTGFVSVTDGWEPGLRSRETLRHLVGALGAAEAADRFPGSRCTSVTSGPTPRTSMSSSSGSPVVRCRCCRTATTRRAGSSA